jgi:transposase-like protein
MGVASVIRKGYRYNKVGKKQLWKCAKCNKKFTPDNGFWKMKNTPETVAEALDLYEVGHSLTATKEHLWKHHGIKISETSIRNWVIKYCKKITNYTETLPVKVKDRIHEDEVEIRVNKKKTYFWRGKENKTGFKFSGPVGRRSMENCQRLNRQIKKRSYNYMLGRKKSGKKKIKFVSDKLAHYKTTHNKLFRNTTDITHGIPIKAKQKGLKYNNNVIECEHPAVNLRIRQMKGVKDNDFAEAVLHLKDTLDNFTKRRNRKSKTPAELAGINLDLGRNKTLNLIYILRLAGPEEFIESLKQKN